MCVHNKQVGFSPRRLPPNTRLRTSMWGEACGQGVVAICTTFCTAPVSVPTRCARRILETDIGVPLPLQEDTTRSNFCEALLTPTLRTEDASRGPSSFCAIRTARSTPFAIAPACQWRDPLTRLGMCSRAIARLTPSCSHAMGCGATQVHTTEIHFRTAYLATPRKRGSQPTVLHLPIWKRIGSM